ncbi:hypothetical protein GQ600_19696 [Phytophthora cactorum]|nr:hypothetical protein GQ600_19696 [Phytophthora cactorum]
MSITPPCPVRWAVDIISALVHCAGSISPPFHYSEVQVRINVVLDAATLTPVGRVPIRFSTSPKPNRREQYSSTSPGQITSEHPKGSDQHKNSSPSQTEGWSLACSALAYAVVPSNV